MGFSLPKSHRKARNEVQMGEYPYNWPTIAKQIKDTAGWRCIECNAHTSEEGHVLTVHHKDGDPANCEHDNLEALCQKCNLRKQDARWRQMVKERKLGYEQGELL